MDATLTGGSYAEDGKAAGRPGRLRILVIAPTYGTLSGADLDWVSLLNALGPTRVRVDWVGLPGSRAAVSASLDPAILGRAAEVEGSLLPVWKIARGDYRGERQLLARTIAAHCRDWVRARSAIATLRQPAMDWDVVVTVSSSLPLGPLIAASFSKPHYWSVKEPIDPQAARWIRNYLRYVGFAGEFVAAASDSVAAQFNGLATTLHDGTDIRAVRRSASKGRKREDICRDLGLDPALPIVLQNSRIDVLKGQHVLAQAFVRLCENSSTPPFHLVIAGSGTPAAVARVERILDEPTVREQVRFVEYASGDFSLLNAADIVAHPVTAPDPYPNSIREALSLGKPVIAGDCGGLRELITDDVNGLLVPPGDPDRTAAAIRSLIDDPARRESLGAAAKSHAEAYVDIEQLKGAFWEVLQSVAARGRLSTLSRARLALRSFRLIR